MPAMPRSANGQERQVPALASASIRQKSSSGFQVLQSISRPACETTVSKEVRRAIVRARILDLRPAKVHGPPRSTATGPVGSLPRRSRSIGKIITPWLRIMLVALGVGAVVGPLDAAADTAAPHGKAAAGAHRQATAKPPTQPTATATVCSANMGAQPYSWMGDIAPCIINRRLTDIVIPGSHDSTTYGFSGLGLSENPVRRPLHPAGQRRAAVRHPGWVRPGNLWQRGRNCQSCRLLRGTRWFAGTSLADSLCHLYSAGAWADAGNAAVNHGQEIIMVSLTVDQDTAAAFPTDECRDLASAGQHGDPRNAPDGFRDHRPGRGHLRAALVTAQTIGFRERGTRDHGQHAVHGRHG